MQSRQPRQPSQPRQPWQRHKAAILATCASLTVVALVAVLSIVAQVNAPRVRVARPPRPPAHWIVSTGAISQLRGAGARASLISKSFVHRSSYVLANPGPGTFGVRTAIYDSFRAIERAFATGTLPGSYQAVVYDSQASPATPTAEQRDPAKYERMAGRLLHKHGLLYIAAPALDLVGVLNRGSAGSRARSLYLSDHIAADAARRADAVVIQAQQTEGSRKAYAGFVKAAAAQARAARPGVMVFAGLKLGSSVRSRRLSADYSSVRSAVDGYWLISVPGARCVPCQRTGTLSAPGGPGGAPGARQDGSALYKDAPGLLKNGLGLLRNIYQ